MRHARRTIWLSLFLCLAGVAAARAETRVALVIGNTDYAHTTKPKTARADAQAVGAALRRAGFNVVEGYDLDRAAFEAKIRAFAAQLPGADTALVYYAGQGLQVERENWLVPVDADVRSARDLTLASISLTTLLARMEGNARVRLVFLDASHDHAMARHLASAEGPSGDSGRGLARVRPSQGTLLAYAAQPGAISQEGSGAYGNYASALLALIGTPELEIGEMMKRVSVRVQDETGGAQVPWFESSLTGDFYFGSGTAPGATVAAPAPGALARPSEPAGPTVIDAYRDVPQSPDLKRARALFEKGDLAGAVRIADDVLARSPGDVAFRFLRGIAQQILSDCYTSTRDLRDLDVSRLPRSVQYHRYASLAICSVDPVANANAALKLYPNYYYSYATRGFAYASVNDFAAAVADMERAVQLDSRVSSLLALRGAYKCLNGQRNAGLEDLTRARQLSAANREDPNKDAEVEAACNL